MVVSCKLLLQLDCICLILGGSRFIHGYVCTRRNNHNPKSIKSFLPQRSSTHLGIKAWLGRRGASLPDQDQSLPEDKWTGTSTQHRPKDHLPKTYAGRSSLQRLVLCLLQGEMVHKKHRTYHSIWRSVEQILEDRSSDQRNMTHSPNASVRAVLDGPQRK